MKHLIIALLVIAALVIANVLSAHTPITAMLHTCFTFIALGLLLADWWDFCDEVERMTDLRGVNLWDGDEPY